ncbi:MAG: YicC/YloC family endoribonuclease [Pyrinomonadaceae bacterium]
MKSMTGFGRGEASGENFSVSAEIKTVNNRFLDVNLRLSSELQSLESDIKKLISDRLSRGRVDVNINYEKTSDVVYELNRPLISGYVSTLKEIQNEYSLSGEPDLNVIARLPNSIQTKKDDLSEGFARGVKDAVSEALGCLEVMRENEGNSLKTDLSSLLENITSQMPAIESESESVAEEYFQRLTKRIEKLLSRSDSQIEIDQARLAQEVAYLADKSDISEEITRLKIHVEQFFAILGEDGPVGKRLDFLTQELNREANTISSKTQNMVVKEAALAMKADIEKIREQIQNVE